MKRKILNVVRGLYYGTGELNSYFKTISMLTLMILIHLFQIGIIIYKLSGAKIDFFPMPDIHRAAKYLFMFLYLTPIYLVLTQVFPKKALINHDMDNTSLKKQRNIFVVYSIVNVLILVALISDKIRFQA